MEQDVAVTTAAPLSEARRVLDTFVSPSNAFTDVCRSARWWLPFLLIVLCGYVLTAAIQTRVGWAQMVDNQITSNPRLSERLSAAEPAQVAQQRRAMRYSFQGGFYAAPLLNLLFFAIMALVLWPTINFGFAGSATFGRVFCVVVYASLPTAIAALLAAGMLYTGRSADTFTAQTMLGSNPGYYIEAPGALKAFLSALDLFTLWTALLLSIGIAIVARTKRSAGFFAVFGWYAIVVLFKTVTAALQS